MRLATPSRPTAVAQRYFFTLASVVLTVFALIAAKPVLVPLALATLFAFVLAPVVRWGERVGLGRTTATLATIAVAFGLAAVLGFVITAQVASFANELPAHQSKIEAKLEGLRGGGGPFSRLATMVQELAQAPVGEGEAAAVPPTRVQIESHASMSETLEPIIALLEPVATAALVLVLMVFVLLGRDDLRSRLLATLGQTRLIGTVRALEDSTDRLGRYLLMQLTVNAGLGAAFGVGLFIMGVPFAALWAVLMALFRFIPFVGTWIALLMPLSLSFATSPDWSQPVAMLAYFAVLDLVTANVVEPLLFGHHTGVSPLALLTAAAFWAWVWGPIGLLLSTPLTVCLAVIGQHFAPVKALGLLLGVKRALPPHIEFYQRALADGGPTAAAVAVDAAAAGAVAASDSVLIKALSMARKDRAAGRLTRDEEAQIRDGVIGAIAPLLAVPEAHAVPTAQLHLVGIPAHDACEEVPLQLLAHIVERGGGRMTCLSTRMLPGELVRQVGMASGATVVISSMAPGGLPQTAFLCRQLREQYPNLVIIVVRWGGGRAYDTLLVRLRKAGASYLTTSIAQTVAQANARFSDSAAGPDEAPLDAAVTGGNASAV